MAGRDGPSLAAVYDRVAAHLVGRERELTLVLAAVAAGRDIILEGPPGTSKSTLLRAITAEWGIPMVFVEGNTDLTPSKLIGNVGTTRLSTSVHDRICRLAIGYQDAAAERGIVALRAPLPSVAPGLYQRLVADAVAGTRATREHPDIRQGSSVRGAIDLTLVAGQLLELHGPGEYAELVYDAMVVALSGRIFLDETVDAEPRLLDVSGRGGAGDLALTGDRGGRPGGPRAGSGGPALTTERSGLSAVPDGEGPDPEALRRARQIAARLAVPRPRRDVTARRGLGGAAVRLRAQRRPGPAAVRGPAAAAGRAARHLGRAGRRTRPRAGPPRSRTAAPDRRLHRRRSRPGRDLHLLTKGARFVRRRDRPGRARHGRGAGHRRGHGRGAGRGRLAGGRGGPVRRRPGAAVPAGHTGRIGPGGRGGAGSGRGRGRRGRRAGPGRAGRGGAAGRGALGRPGRGGRGRGRHRRRGPGLAGPARAGTGGARRRPRRRAEPGPRGRAGPAPPPGAAPRPVRRRRLGRRHPRAADARRVLRGQGRGDRVRPRAGRRTRRP